MHVALLKVALPVCLQRRGSVDACGRHHDQGPRLTVHAVGGSIHRQGRAPRGQCRAAATAHESTEYGEAARMAPVFSLSPLGHLPLLTRLGARLRARPHEAP